MISEATCNFTRNLQRTQSFLEHSVRSFKACIKELNNIGIDDSKEIFLYNLLRQHFGEIVHHLELVIFSFKQITYHLDKMAELDRHRNISKRLLSLGSLRFDFIENEAPADVPKVTNFRLNREMKPALQPKPAVWGSPLSSGKTKDLSMNEEECHSFSRKNNDASSTSYKADFENDSYGSLPHLDLNTDQEVTKTKSIRRTYSLKQLQEWEKLWEKNKNPIAPVKKRPPKESKNDSSFGYSVSGRIQQFEKAKNNKRISSTVENFLDISEGKERNSNAIHLDTVKEGALNESVQKAKNSDHTVSFSTDEASIRKGNEFRADSISETKQSQRIIEARNSYTLSKSKSMNSLTFKSLGAAGNPSSFQGITRTKSDTLTKPRIVDVIYKKKPL